jgi:hypothetical protein
MMDRPKWIDASDDYTIWLSFANAGMLNKGNLYCLDHAISHLPTNDPIVEIGSFAGLSVNLITYYKRKYGRANKLITCDKWDFEGAKPGKMLGESPILHDDYRQFVRDTFIRNVRFFSGYDLPYTVEMFSDELFGAWRSGQASPDVFGRQVQLGGPISFCYIDGNHSYEFARRDFEHTDEFLVSGGFILFDDSADGSKWQVCRVIEEVKASGRYDVVAANPNYLFVKR